MLTGCGAGWPATLDTLSSRLPARRRARAGQHLVAVLCLPVVGAAAGKLLLAERRAALRQVRADTFRQSAPRQACRLARAGMINTIEQMHGLLVASSSDALHPSVRFPPLCSLAVKVCAFIHRLRTAVTSPALEN